MKQQDMQRDKEIASMTKKKNSIKDVKDEMLFSKETEDDRGVIIPKCIKFKNINVAGK